MKILVDKQKGDSRDEGSELMNFRLSFAPFPDFVARIRYLAKHNKRMENRTTPPVTPPKIPPRLRLGVAELEFVVEDEELVDIVTTK